MADATLKTFYDDYLKALEEGYAAVFAGAGLSRPAGFVDWKELLKDVAEDLGLNVEFENDLISLAQYHVNTHDTRHRLNTAIIEGLTKDVKMLPNHSILARLPLHTVWTTNYDTLIEDAFKAVGKRADVKRTPANLSLTLPYRDATIYKMHGDVALPDEAVLTKDDYESYNEKRQMFTELLKGDLIGKTFLFLGFSFTDPNIDYILSRIRILFDRNKRQHYCIMKREIKPAKVRGAKLAEFEYRKKKQELQIADLKRYGIRPLMIDDYKEITSILEHLLKHSHRKDIFISGSAHEYRPWDGTRIQQLARRLGLEVVKRGFNLVSGFGLGIGNSVLVGGLEAQYADDNIREERIKIRPFPQTELAGTDLKQFWTKYREEMISSSGYSIFMCGNKKKNDQTVIADGVLEEFEITKRMGKYPIPIGATGDAARQIWEEVNASLDSFFPAKKVKKQFQVLGNEAAGDDEIVSAVFEIIQQTSGK